MNTGNNNGNQSIDGFDDMNFDDMIIDDVPLPDFDDETSFQNNTSTQNFQPQSNSNYVGNQVLGNTQQKTLINDTENITKKSKLKKEKAPKDPKEPKQKKEKTPKQPKQKKEKAPKQQKVAKQPKQKVKNSNAQGMYLNNGVIEDAPKKHTALKVGIPAAILVIVGLVAAVKLNAPRNSEYHITLADNTAKVVEEEVASNDTSYKIEVSDSSNGESTYTSGTNSSNIVLALGGSYDIPVSVNTKLEGETEYSEHDASINIKYTDFICGYDNVIEYINSYNETSSRKINLADKEDFYNSSVGNDIVMYELTVTVPDDFPSNDIEHGYTGLSPAFSFSIAGTDKEDALITQLYEFAIPSITDISDNTDPVKIGQTYKLRYVTTMPMSLSASGYSLTLAYDCNNAHIDFTVESQDIPNNSDAVEMTDEATETVENTETE